MGSPALPDDVLGYVFQFINQARDIQALRLCSPRFCRIADRSISSVRLHGHGVGKKGDYVSQRFIDWCGKLHNLTSLIITKILPPHIDNFLSVLAHSSQLRTLELLYLDREQTDEIALKFCTLRDSVYHDLPKFTSLVLGYVLNYRRNTLRCGNTLFPSTLIPVVVGMFNPHTVELDNITPAIRDAVKRTASIKRIKYWLAEGGSLAPLIGLHDREIILWGERAVDVRMALRNVNRLIAHSVVELDDIYLRGDEVEDVMRYAPNIKSLIVYPNYDATDELFALLVKMFLRYPQLKIHIEEDITYSINNKEALEDAKLTYASLLRPWHLLHPFTGRLFFNYIESTSRCMKEGYPEEMHKFKAHIDRREAELS